MQIAQVMAGAIRSAKADCWRRAMGARRIAPRWRCSGARLYRGLRSRTACRKAQGGYDLRTAGENSPTTASTKSHARPMALGVFPIQRLHGKAHYPVEFCGGAMKLNSTNTDKLSDFRTGGRSGLRHPRSRRPTSNSVRPTSRSRKAPYISAEALEKGRRGPAGGQLIRGHTEGRRAFTSLADFAARVKSAARSQAGDRKPGRRRGAVDTLIQTGARGVAGRRSDPRRLSAQANGHRTTWAKKKRKHVAAALRLFAPDHHCFAAD